MGEKRGVCSKHQDRRGGRGDRVRPARGKFSFYMFLGLPYMCTARQSVEVDTMDRSVGLQILYLPNSIAWDEACKNVVC